MGYFSRRLVVQISDSDQFPFQVYEPFEFHSGLANSGLLLRVEAGFAFNGTSIPVGLRWLISPSDPELLQCAAAHDKGFETGMMIMRVDDLERPVPVSRVAINALMAEMMVVYRVTPWKRRLINAGLLLGSRGVWVRARRADPPATLAA